MAHFFFVRLFVRFTSLNVVFRLVASRFVLLRFVSFRLSNKAGERGHSAFFVPRTFIKSLVRAVTGRIARRIRGVGGRGGGRGEGEVGIGS